MPLQNKNSITLPFQANIWKIHVNSENFLLVLELRNEELRQASFAGIDLERKKILWHQNNLQEKWWIGLVESKGDYVLLHGYKDLQSPIHLKAFVLNVKNGELLWKNEAIKPLGFNSDQEIVGQEENNELSLLNASNGNLIKRIAQEEYSTPVDKSALSNPQFYSVENKYFEKIAFFIEHITAMKPEQAIEYIEFESKIISSFYVKKEEKLVNYLLVVNEEGDIISLQEIGSDLNSAAPDTFFLVKDKLVYIKNKKELVIFEL